MSNLRAATANVALGAAPLRYDPEAENHLRRQLEIALSRAVDVRDPGAVVAADITGIVGLAHGGTAADLSATGPGFFKQATAGAAATVAAVTKSDVGLGSVENTALSTWAGSTNLTTLGTIGTGTVPWAHLAGVQVHVWMGV